MISERRWCVLAFSQIPQGDFAEADFTAISARKTTGQPVNTKTRNVRMKRPE
jgi:hypothetical protein